jgi:hypothetical protein
MKAVTINILKSYIKLDEISFRIVLQETVYLVRSKSRIIKFFDSILHVFVA